MILLTSLLIYVFNVIFCKSLNFAVACYEAISVAGEGLVSAFPKIDWKITGVADLLNFFSKSATYSNHFESWREAARSVNCRATWNFGLFIEGIAWLGPLFANGHPTRCDSSLDHSLEYEQVDDKREWRFAFPHGKWSINSQQQIL